MKDVRSAKSVNYSQIDNKVKKIIGRKGVTILQSPEAYEKFGWVRDYFEQEPEEGYFIWVKKQTDHPLTTCIAISSPEVSQNPRNLVVIEKNIEAEINSVCNAIKKNLCGSHIGHSKIILKENSRLKIRHFHKWGKRDVVESNLEFFLGKGAELSHTYKCIEVPMKLKMKNNTYIESGSSANLVITVLAKYGKVEIYDSTFLNGKESNGISRIRMIGDKKSRITAHSKMIANDAGTGHVDCMGLLLAEDSSINAIPELVNNNKDASLTHEASVGKISEEVLNYLRSRGLTEDQAIDLIVAGFLGEEESVVIEGRVIPSELYM
ncbi:MAG: SufD family Fe-S cluster assembly protein [Candidatus Thermoplasmatota archaeon]|nr:SufD family Fe-S cluster assembly protein [Candidatus Thermoplasmatota archaeon]